MPDAVTYIAIGIIIGAAATVRAFFKWETRHRPPADGTKQLKL